MPVMRSAIGLIIGSQFSSALGSWRWALRASPPIGFLLAVLLLCTTREMPRGYSDRPASAVPLRSPPTPPPLSPRAKAPKRPKLLQRDSGRGTAVSAKDTGSQLFAESGEMEMSGGGQSLIVKEGNNSSNDNNNNNNNNNNSSDDGLSDIDSPPQTRAAVPLISEPPNSPASITMLASTTTIPTTTTTTTPTRATLPTITLSPPATHHRPATRTLRKTFSRSLFSPSDLSLHDRLASIRAAARLGWQSYLDDLKSLWKIKALVWLIAGSTAQTFMSGMFYFVILCV